jgi:hypothetical protein
MHETHHETTKSHNPNQARTLNKVGYHQATHEIVRIEGVLPPRGIRSPEPRPLGRSEADLSTDSAVLINELYLNILRFT